MTTTLTLYNTRSRAHETFAPHGDTVTVYACGPTVYGAQHIGNLRSAMTADILVRTLELLGYAVHYTSNITDVGHLTADDIAQGDSGEDKMIAAAARERRTPEEIARHYEQQFVADADALALRTPTERPRATEHIPQMIAMITRLIERGHAYVANGNVFFDVTSFPAYGALSGNTLRNLKIGARLTEAHPDKRHQWDFALWLKAPRDHLMRWPSPWSVGYPGWHIECSAMSTHYLGTPIDIHLGGEDNIFPHHEAEIAQSECALDTPFVRYWIHTRHLLVNGAKMSKSKGNVYTLADIRARGFAPADLRMLYLGAHYRSQMNFTWDALHQARRTRRRFRDTRHRVRSAAPGTKTIDIAAARDAFLAALCDDLNTPRAIAVIMETLTTINATLHADGIANIAEVRTLLDDFNALCAVPDDAPATLPADITAIARARDAARAARDYARADALRDELTARGYNVEDTPNGTRVTPL